MGSSLATLGGDFREAKKGDRAYFSLYNRCYRAILEKKISLESYPRKMTIEEIEFGLDLKKNMGRT